MTESQPPLPGVLCIVLTGISWVLNGFDWSLYDVNLISPLMHFAQLAAATIGGLLGIVALYDRFIKKK